jgi:hypothetical protein
MRACDEAVCASKRGDIGDTTPVPFFFFFFLLPPDCCCAGGDGVLKRYTDATWRAKSASLDDVVAAPATGGDFVVV